MDPSWDRVTEVPRLQDVFERFGDERIYGPPVSFALRTGREPERTQISSSTTGRMIQLQDTRLILNWRKMATAPEYPSFAVLCDEFMTLLGTFCAFADAVGTPSLEFNQWEVVYVNHIPKGPLWSSVQDWDQVLNFFSIPDGRPGAPQCDTFAGQWVLELPSRRGRLHIAVQHGKAENAAGAELMVLQLTARGPTSSDRSLEADLEIGHEAIVSSFASMTCEAAHNHWKRTK